MRKTCSSGLPGTGEYDRDGNAAREAARSLFLESVHKYEPNVLGTLARAPFEAFERLHGRLDLGTRVDKALGAWLRRWHLPCPPEEDDWCFQRAIDTMATWTAQPELRGKRWAPARRRMHVDWVSSDELTFRFGLVRPDLTKNERAPSDWWDPTLERRSDAFERIQNAFRGELEAHFRKLERLYESASEAGYDVARKKRELEHFDWLARYQVGGQSRGAIARSVPRDRKAVANGIDDVAELIGLVPRSSRPGRPKLK